jgi:hypothetical protein
MPATPQRIWDAIQRRGTPLLPEAYARNQNELGHVPVRVSSGHGMIVYGSMDRQTLDAAYNNSAAVADSYRYLADWVRCSEALRARVPDHLDLAYGDAPRARLDFFPANRTGAATLLFFHGGYWQRNAKEGFSFVAEGPLAHGFHVAVAGYTLAPEATMDDIVREARTALRWLHQHLATLGGDPARVYVGGWSAGGHLAGTRSLPPHSCSHQSRKRFRPRNLLKAGHGAPPPKMQGRLEIDARRSGALKFPSRAVRSGTPPRAARLGSESGPPSKAGSAFPPPSAV